MKIGLVIPVFNRPILLKRMLDSLRKSFLPPVFEVFMVDDSSTDSDTVELFNKFSIPGVPITKIRNAKNQGVAYGLKKGFEYFYSNGCEIVCNLDSDAIVKPYWLTTLLGLHDKFPSDIITGFNTPSHLTTDIFTGFHFKKTIGGISLLFGKEIIPHVCECLVDDQWDWRLSMESGYRFIATNPSVIQHLGYDSSSGHKRIDIAETWIDIPPTPININLYICLYPEFHLHRIDEYVQCMKQNNNNRFISNIYCLVEPKTNVSRYEISNKTTLIPVAHRPTYTEMFDLANLHANSDTISIISNLDIYFDDTIVLSNSIFPHECFALLRYDQGKQPRHPNGTLVACSQDVWIFRGKIKMNTTAGFPLGKPGCDNRIAHIAKSSGYKVCNPSFDIKTHHIHNSGLRHYTERDRIRGAYLDIQPCSLSKKLFC